MKIDELPYLRGVGSGTNVIPEVLYIGRSECQWPMQVWESPVHAVGWAVRAETGYPRHIYKLEVRTGEITEMELVPEVPAVLRERVPSPTEDALKGEIRP